MSAVCEVGAVVMRYVSSDRWSSWGDRPEAEGCVGCALLRPEQIEAAQRQPDIGHRSGKQADMVERIAERVNTFPRNRPEGGLEPHDPAKGGGTDD